MMMTPLSVLMTGTSRVTSGVCELVNSLLLGLYHLILEVNKKTINFHVIRFHHSSRFNFRPAFNSLFQVPMLGVSLHLCAYKAIHCDNSLYFL